MPIAIRPARGPSPGRALVAIALAVGLGCGEPERPGDPADGAGPEAGPAPLEPAPGDPIARFRERTPDSLLRRDGACPFECCTYGTWTAPVELELLAAPRAGAAPVGSIPAGEPFEAETGVVFITGFQIVAATDSLNRGGERRPEEPRAFPWSAAIAPGDTLVVLDYVGEGFYRLWNGREVLETQQFWAEGGVGSLVDPPAGHAIGEHATEWWIRARSADGTVGWLAAPEGPVEGRDACG